ncbi:MAG: tetratricopeptide repeat protein, partial [Calditrichia bacterium]
DRALEEFETVLEMTPDRKMNYNDLGYVYAQRGDFTTAIQYIDKYRELAPDEPNPYDSKGEILMMAGELEKAIEQYRMALELWPSFTYSAVQLGALYREMGNYQKSIHYLDKASKIEGNMQWKLNIDFNKAATYWKFKKYDKAATVFQEIIKDRPNDWFFPLLAGEMYESIGKEDLAGKVYRGRFDYFIKEINNSDAPGKAVNQFKSYVISLNFPQNEVLPVLEKYTSDKDIPENIRLGINFVLSLLYHRAGNDEKANKVLEKHSEKLVKTLSDNRKIGWTNVLQYLFESQVFTNTEKLTELLLKSAEEKNREDLTAIAHLLRANSARSKGNKIKVENEYQAAGFPLEAKWRVAGPFSQQNTSEFIHAFPPEKSVDLNDTYYSNGRTVKWTPADDKMVDGYVNLGGLYPQSYWSVAYAVVYVYSPGKRKAQIRLGSNDACKLWLNDKLIWKHYLLEDAILDRDMVTVVLRPGYNKMLLKVTNTLNTWGFYLRITDENGNGYSDINFFSPEEVKQPIALKD